MTHPMNILSRKRNSRVLFFVAATGCLFQSLQAAEITYDFRGQPYDPALFRLTGPGASTAIRSDSRGLRITLPPEHGMKPAVGLVLNSGLKGDFEITMEYEILEAERPTGGNGAGVSIWITMVSYTKEAATIWRMNRSGTGLDGSKNSLPLFGSHRASTPIGGTREHSGGDLLLARAAFGKLRLARTGSTLTYRVADGASDEFQDIYETELGEDDVDTVRFAADNGGSPTLVDVLIRGVHIRSDEAGPVELLPPLPSRWPAVLVIGAGVLILGGSYWYWRQR
jgi:hypothetical protein